MMTYQLNVYIDQRGVRCFVYRNGKLLTQVIEATAEKAVKLAVKEARTARRCKGVEL